MVEYKQAILLRKDLSLPRGKAGAQIAHASVGALLKSHKDDISKWQNQGMKKVVLEVADKETLFKYKQKAEDAGLVVAVVTDAGKTVVAPGTVTCLGIGPDKEEKVDSVTGDLKLIS